MTHGEVRSRLRAYADGTLDDAAAEIVRAHLAAGCGECLREVFTRRVGLPRVPLVVHRMPRRFLAVVVTAGIVLGAGVGLLVGMSRRVRPPAADAAVETLAAEVERLRREREVSEAASRERLARLEARVVEAERQAAAERSTAPAPVAAQALVEPAAPPAPAAMPSREMPPDWLETLLATDGARLLPLRPAESAPGASGYAVWSRARGIVVVSATDLPAGRSDAVYRVRVRLSGGATVWAGDQPASERGTVVLTAAMPEGTGWRVVGVDLYRDPPNAPALTASLRP